MGTLVDAVRSDFVSLAGPGRPRQSRFYENSEALSNWAVAHQVRGYLRSDGIYVWYLSDEAAASAAANGFPRIQAVWLDADA
jgi:hypothetical protein